MARVLVVEDDAHIRDLIVLHLGLEGLETEAGGRRPGRAGARAAPIPSTSIILDLMLPGVDGIAVCRAVRREGPNQDVPILMLTARARGKRQGAGPRERRRRLPRQAVWHSRAGGARARAAAAAAAIAAAGRSRERGRAARRDPRPAHRSGAAPRPRAGARMSISPRRSFACCTCSPRIPASSSAAKRC